MAHGDSAPAVAALLSGDVNLSFDTLTVLAPQIKAGKVKGIAIASRERSPLLPNVPTVAEAGYPDFEVVSWFGLAAPAATPKEIVARLNTELTRIANSTEVKGRFAAQGVEVLSSTPDGFAKLIRDDHARWGKVVKASGAKLD